MSHHFGGTVEADNMILGGVELQPVIIVHVDVPFQCLQSIAKWGRERAIIIMGIGMRVIIEVIVRIIDKVAGRVVRGDIRRLGVQEIRINRRVNTAPSASVMRRRGMRQLSTSWGTGLSERLSTSSIWAWRRKLRVRRVLVSGGTSPPCGQMSM